MKPEVVVFDLGKVLLHFDYSIAVSKLRQMCRVPFEEIVRLLDQSPLLHQYECNQVSTAQFFQSIRDLSGFSGNFSQFQEIFGDIFSPVDEMIQLNRRLRAFSIPTIIFSNTNEMAVQHIRRAYPFFAEFDDYVLSCEHGVMKPDLRLYEVLESRTGRSGDQLLYIDDRPENVAAGETMGWLTILHQQAEATIRAVAEYGLLAR
jgi:HAD superfamily hydrolase (TIGR01509 family)